VVLVATLGLMACSGDSGDAVPTARTLARRLDEAGVCTHVRPSSPQETALMRPAGMTNTWACLAPSPDNDAHGGIEVGLWAGRTPAEKRRVLTKMNGLLRGVCSSTTGAVTGKSSTSAGDGETSATTAAVRAAPREVTERYVEGVTWLAVVGINARFEAVASTLHGTAVTKHC
jgi:hypothetical protein